MGLSRKVIAMIIATVLLAACVMLHASLIYDKRTAKTIVATISDTQGNIVEHKASSYRVTREYLMIELSDKQLMIPWHRVHSFELIAKIKGE